MPNGVAMEKQGATDAIEAALVQGDLSKLSPNDRLSYYMKTCDSLGLSPYTKPFEYIILNGKLQLYALRAATDQLRKLHEVSIIIVGREQIGDVYIVTARATLPSGRTDESTGAVSVANLKGDNLANAFLKCETKAKRRVTLSICGLGMLDQTEIDSIPDKAKTVPPDAVVYEEDEEAACDEWQMRFEQAPTVEAVETLRTEFKSKPHADTLTLKISKFYNAAKKRVSNG